MGLTHKCKLFSYFKIKNSAHKFFILDFLTYKNLDIEL
jgi:hypothetical protein